MKAISPTIGAVVVVTRRRRAKPRSFIFTTMIRACLAPTQVCPFHTARRSLWCYQRLQYKWFQNSLKSSSTYSLKSRRTSGWVASTRWWTLVHDQRCLSVFSNDQRLLWIFSVAAESVELSLELTPGRWWLDQAATLQYIIDLYLSICRWQYQYDCLSIISRRLFKKIPKNVHE